MTEKQKIFADEYLIDLNATRAYRVAYPSVKKEEAAAVNGSKLLRNTKVAAYIQERMQERQKRTEITQDRVLQELAAIAFAKATDYAEIKNECVRIKDTAELDEQQVRALAGIEEGKFGIKVKLNDKYPAWKKRKRNWEISWSSCVVMDSEYRKTDTFREIQSISQM